MSVSVFPGEPVTLVATAEDIDLEHLDYRWKTADGRVIGTSPSITVPTSGMSAGKQNIEASVTDRQGNSASCAVSIVIKAFAPPTVSCSADPSKVFPGDSSTISCLAMSPQNRPLSYSYIATGGMIFGTGRRATLRTTRWFARDITVHVNVTDDKGQTATADTSVTVSALPADALPAAAPPAIENTGREFLLSGDSEEPGYGLYSYLLWRNTPSPQDRARYLSVISAFLLIPKASVEEGREMTVDSAGHSVPPAEVVQPKNLNVAYIPVNAVPPADVTAEWVLDNYDVNRARLLLNRVPENLNQGPYIISSLHPLRSELSPSDHILFQNLSSPSITDDIAYQWVRLFQDQALRQEFWRADMMADFVLGMRTKVSLVAGILPPTIDGLAIWIKWFSPSAH
jgi:hypothetical protein